MSCIASSVLQTATSVPMIWIWRSLRAKLIASFTVVALALIGFAALTVLELRELEQRIAVDHVTTHMFDLVREVRNRENRLFLFRRTADFRELIEAIDESVAFVSDAPWPPDEKPAGAINNIRDGLRTYRDRVERYWQSGRMRREGTGEAEEEIRGLRRQYIDLAESVAKNAAERVRQDIERHRWRLAAWISCMVLLMVAVANFLIRRIVRPLTAIENEMQQVAVGRSGRVSFRWEDRELVSLADAFNRVMSELEARQARALKAEKLASLGVMLSGVAHELNNPLSNISTSVQILNEEADRLSVEEVRERAAKIDRHALRARAIVRSVLEYARSDADAPRAVVVLRAVEAAVEAINQGRAHERHVMVDGASDIVVAAHSDRLRRALINLLENAMAATDDADPVVVLVRAVASGDRKMVEIAIQDCGSGMESAQRERMFDPFYTTKAVGQGTGLGLYLTHEIIKQYGGTIDVISIPGGGTSVIVRLPGSETEPKT